MILTDRSRIKAYQECPRSRYLGYEIHGQGLQRKRVSLPLQFGSAFHAGAELLLAGKVDEAVQVAHKFLKEQFDAHAIGFDGELPDDAQKALEYGREEQMALAEALLRGWWAFEGPTFLETFEVLEVEKEGRATLRHGAEYTLVDSRLATDKEKVQEIDWVDIYRSHGTDPEIVLMFRPDALVRDRQSGDLFVISWKTCSTFGKRNIDQCRHDMQSISEVWGLEETNREG